jgi:hypothetical protein
MRPSALPICFVAFLTLAPGARAQQMERGWPASRGVAVRVLNLAGTTRVVGWDRDSVAVTASVASGGNLYGGGTRAAIKLGVEPSEPGGEAPSATLEVRVPRGAVVSVKSATADVDVREVRGSVEVMSVGGQVTVTGDPRQVNVESMTGDVTVRGDAPVVRVRTAGGDATVDGTVEDLRIETVSGPIAVRAARPRRTRLESTTGSVAFVGGLARDGTMDVHTHESTVRLTFPETIAASFDLTTFDGLLINRFGNTAARPSRGGKPLRFTTNGGGAQVTVRTLKGDVAIYRR